jgi:hypothetical protein
MPKSNPELPDNLLDDRVVNFDQTAAAANIHPRTLRRYSARGIGPRVTRLSERKFGVRIRDLRAWLESRATPVDA